MTITLNDSQRMLLREIMHEYQGFAPSSPRGREKKKLAEALEKMTQVAAMPHNPNQPRIDL